MKLLLFANLVAATLQVESANAQLPILRGRRPKRGLEATDDQAVTFSWGDPSSGLVSISLSMSMVGEELLYAGATKSSKSSKPSKSGKATNNLKCSADNSYPTLDLSEAFQPLHQPPQVKPDHDGVTRLTMTYDLVNYKGPSFTTILRLHNGIAPGSTLHVIPGGRMEIELVNCLQPPLGFNGPDAHNQHQIPNTTNLHTHGLHISGELPGDNIFVEVEPEEVHKYKYEFDENHMPGTFWYHPHVHGSTALQVGQGAVGMIIVDTPDDYPLPGIIKNMPDIQMVFQHLSLRRLRHSSGQSLDDVTNWRDHNFEMTNVTTDLTNMMLVNMQFLPIVTMEVGKWYRWRMVMSSNGVSLAFQSESGNCEFQLLAKDGIYLSDAPREVPVIMISPGNRADVAVRCNEIGQEYMNTTDIDLASNFDPSVQFMMEEDPDIPDLVGTFADPEAQPTIVVIDVVNPRSSKSGKYTKGTDLEPFTVRSSKSGKYTKGTHLEPFTVPTPCYLVDLLSLNDSNISGTFTNRYDCNDSGICGIYGPPGVGGNTSDFRPWVNKTTYINEFAVGTVQDIVIVRGRFHPYHQHINPYQIQKIEPDDGVMVPIELEESVSIWYQVGDWHDTLQLPSPIDGQAGNFGGKVTIRFQVDQFTGSMIQHCHILHHQDTGMMAQYKITGEEYTIWDGARDINPSCILPSGPMKSSDNEEVAYFEHM